MTGHVFEADVSYLSCIGAKYKGSTWTELREAFLKRFESSYAVGETAREQEADGAVDGSLLSPPLGPGTL